MHTPFKPQHPNDRIYAHGSNPVPGFSALDIGSSRPGGPIKDAPMYIGMVFIRKNVPGYPTPSWENCPMPETQEALEHKVFKGRDKSVDYNHPDMSGAQKQVEIDRFIQRENNKYPGYDYKLHLLLLREGSNFRQKRICKQMTVILQRQPAYKPKPKSQAEHPKQDLRGPFSGPPIKKYTQPSYGDGNFGHRNEHPEGGPAIIGFQHQPHDRHNLSPSMPIHAPEHVIPGVQSQSLPHAHLEDDPRFQMPRHEGEPFVEPAQNNRFPEQYFSNAGPPMQNPQVHNHDGLEHYPNTQGSHQTSHPRSGAGLRPMTQEVDPLLQSGAGHPNFQEEYKPRPGSGAGHHPDMQGENNNPPPVNWEGGRFGSRDHHQAHPHGGAGDSFDSRDHHHAHPHGGAEERIDVNGEYLNRPRGGGGPHLEDFQGNQPHLTAQSKEIRSGDTRDGVYRAGKNPEQKINRDSGFFSEESCDSGRSDYHNDENFTNGHTGSRRKYSFSRDYQGSHQKENYNSLGRSNYRDNDSNKKYRKHHPREQFNDNFQRKGSHHSLGSAHYPYESDYNGRNVSHNKIRHNHRNNSHMMDEENGDMHSNGYYKPGADFGDSYSEADSFHSSRGLGSPQKFRRSKRMPNVRNDDLRDRLDMLDERDQGWKRREAEILREQRQRQADKSRLDREREETRNGKGGKGRRSSGGTLPRSRTHRQSDRYH